MSIEEFIIAVFCLIDDQLKSLLNDKKLRQRGCSTKLSDSEVITVEVVGEFLGLDQDKAIWQYFKQHWSHFFPAMPDRTNFVRQAANLHVIKRMLQERLAGLLGAYQDQLHIIDGLPIPVCKFARAYFSRIFKGDAAYGYCATKQERFYGFRGHIVISSTGVITSATFAAANLDERDVCPGLVGNLKGFLLGDKGYIRPCLKEELKMTHLHLQTPVRENMQEDRPLSFVKWMMSTRRLVETVIGQLSERFHIEKVRARDLWHQASRFWRKLLAHTVCVKINLTQGNELAKGFACARCEDCRQEFLIAFSCKGRGICPSCNTRAMVETAANLIDNILPHISMRQWVMSFPMRIRHYLQTHEILQAVLKIVVDEIRKRLIACSPEVPNAQIGAVSFIQHFGNTLNLNTS